ncbi:MAG: peptide deformylase [Coriobacteriia bacterium]|nr:peptide deformylase [Coriobacteriia bacterium]
MAYFLKNLMGNAAKGRVRELAVHPNPVLTQACDEIDLQGERDSTAALARDLIATMRAYEGVGLAAIQVGVPKRILVYDVSGEDSGPGDEPQVLVNPRIVETAGESITDEEGCLSFPNVYFPVERPATVTVVAQDLAGKEVRIEDAEGMLARVLQHEIDHLDGVMILARAKPHIRTKALRAFSTHDPTSPDIITITDEEG